MDATDLIPRHHFLASVRWGAVGIDGDSPCCIGEAGTQSEPAPAPRVGTFVQVGSQIVAGGEVDGLVKADTSPHSLQQGLADVADVRYAPPGPVRVDDCVDQCVVKGEFRAVVEEVGTGFLHAPPEGVLEVEAGHDEDQSGIR